jgi:CRP/FNR family transcriptional regulator, cyclic AMP receptor protein
VARGIPSDVIRHFQAVPLFASISKKGIRALVQAADEVDIGAGKVLVREGEWGRELYVILRGTAEVTREGKKLTELVPGDFFGEMAFLSGSRRTATIAARSDMRLMILGPRQLEVILDQEPLLARRMLETMAQRVQAQEKASHTH